MTLPDSDDDRPLSAEAKALLRHATVADLKADAAELAELIAGLDEPLPELPLYRLLVRERERSRRLLDLISRFCPAGGGP